MVRSFILLGSSRRSSTSCVSTEQLVNEKVKEVLQVVRRKGPPLTAKQIEFCNEACIVRFLKAKGSHVKRAAKQLRATLTWRAMLDVDYLTADEFSAELASGNAFVAGQDEEGRPVVIVKLKPECLSSHEAQKQFLRYFAFTMEVAMSCSTTQPECILILDASYLKRGSSPSLSAVAQLLKVIGEHYPERLARAFIVDAPSMFHLFWKGIGKFLDLKMREKLRFVYSRHYINTTSNISSSGSSSVASAAANHLMRAVRSYSNRSLWAESHHSYPHIVSDEEEDEGSELEDVINIIKYKEKLDAKARRQSTLSTTSASLLCDQGHARSLSFASTNVLSRKGASETLEFRSFRADTQPKQRVTMNNEDGSSRRWTGDLIDHYDSSACIRNQDHLNNTKKSLELFRPYYNAFLLRPYNEALYRAYMKPPLAGLISILSSDLKVRQPSFSLSHMNPSCTMEAMLMNHL